MYCSRSVESHLLRGLLALVLIGVGLYLIAGSMPYALPVALIGFAGAFFLFRGCPMCWLMGLFETIHNQRAKSMQKPE